jgi:hypothetical protein
MNRTDPMIAIFPRLTKCIFRTYGASGMYTLYLMVVPIITNLVLIICTDSFSFKLITSLKKDKLNTDFKRMLWKHTEVKHVFKREM